MRSSRRRTQAMLKPVVAPPPRRRGIVLRQARGTERWFFEVELAGELQRIEDRLTRPEYDAAMKLRRLWTRGALNPEAQASCLDRLGMPPGNYHDAADDRRWEAQDDLRAAMRAMGSLGMAGRFAADVVVYERRVETAEEMDALRSALSRLVEHLRPKRSAAA